MRYCKFRIMSNGRITCVAHHQTLMYIFENGNILCQVGEDGVNPVWGRPTSYSETFPNTISEPLNPPLFSFFYDFIAEHVAGVFSCQ